MISKASYPEIRAPALRHFFWRTNKSQKLKSIILYHLVMFIEIIIYMI